MACYISKSKYGVWEGEEEEEKNERRTNKKNRGGTGEQVKWGYRSRTMYRMREEEEEANHERRRREKNG